MMTLRVLGLSICMLTACSQSGLTKKTTPVEYTEDAQPKIFYLAMRVERGKTDRDLKILSVERELMDQENNILPTPQDGEEVFELEFLDRSRQKIGGQTVKTSFKYGEEDAPQAIVKFGSTVPDGAVFARVSYRVSSDVLREIAVYEIVED